MLSPREVCIEHCALEMRDAVNAPDRRAAVDVRRSPQVSFAHARLRGSDRAGLATVHPARAAIQSDASAWILRGDGIGGAFAGGGAGVLGGAKDVVLGSSSLRSGAAR